MASATVRNSSSDWSASGEDDVGAGIDVALHALDGGAEPLDGLGVAAGDDPEVGVGPRLDGGADLTDHLVGGDERLTVEMAATFRELLVLDVDSRRARAFELVDVAHRVQGAAVAGVAVDDERYAGRGVVDIAHRLRHLGKRDHAHVG